MSVISVAICTKNAKILVSRQFQRLTRLELEEHIVHFSRNLEQCKESTLIESEKARYVFLPIETVYILLVTTTNSNIIEDTEILKTLYRILQDICKGGISESAIHQNFFDIVNSIDDVISNGYRESISLNQIQQCLKMESQEEKAFLQLQKQKDAEAKENFKKKMREYEKQKQDKNYKPSGISSGSGFDSSPQEFIKTTNLVEEINNFNAEDEKKNILSKKVNNSKGLKLNNKKQEVVEITSTSLNTNEPEVSEDFVNPLEEPIKIEIEEKIKCEMTKDGELKKFEVKGEAYMTISNPLKRKCGVQLKMDPKQKLVGLAINPSILNKKPWNDKKLLLPENVNEGFPLKTKFNIIKYGIKLKDADVPFIFSCFNSKSGNLNIITLSLESNPQDTFKVIEKMTIKIDFTEKFKAKANSSDFTATDKELTWVIENLRSEDSSSYSLEITTTENVNDLFPLYVNFALNYSIVSLEIENAILFENSENLMYSLKKNCVSEGQDFKILNE